MHSYGRAQFLLKNVSHAALEWPSALKKSLVSMHLDRVVPDAICISGNGPTLVSTDSTTLLWNKETKHTHPASLFIPRILEFRERHPDAWNSSENIFSGPEYLIYLLTDSKITILPEERFKRAYWSEEVLKEAFLEDAIKKLPPFIKPSTLAGYLTRDAAEIFSLPESLPVYAGAPDFVSALVGTATLTPGRLCDRAGSSEGINFCTQKPLTSTGIRTLPSVVPGLWNESVLLPQSGSCFSDFKMRIERERGHEVSYSALVDSILSDIKNNKENDGTILLNKIALDVKNAVNSLKEVAEKNGLNFPDTMTVTGGQGLHGGWNQFKANVTGIKIQVLSCKDAELIGDAIFAFTGMGLYSSITEASKALCKIQETFIPKEAK